MVYIPTRMIISSGQSSTHATLLAPSTIIPQIVARVVTIAPTPASQVCIVKGLRKCAPTLTVLVRIELLGPVRLRAHSIIAFDDQTSTFIIPSGGGFEVSFCPTGRSSNILKVYSQQLDQLAQTGHVSPEMLADTQNVTLQIQRAEGSGSWRPARMLSMLAVGSVVWLSI